MECRQEHGLLEHFDGNVRILVQRAREQRFKLSQARLEHPGNRLRFGVPFSDLAISRGLPVLPNFLPACGGRRLGVFLRPRCDRLPLKPLSLQAALLLFT